MVVPVGCCRVFGAEPLREDLMRGKQLVVVAAVALAVVVGYDAYKAKRG